MLRFIKKYYLPLLAGILISLSRLPIYLGWLVFFALIPLMLFFENKEHKTIDRIIGGLIFSLVQIILVFYWIGSVTFPGLIGIWLIFAVYYTISFWIIERAWHRMPGIRLLTILSVFISFEYLQNFGQMRFPWWNLGYSLTDFLPLLQALDIGGMSLLAGLIVIINYLLYQTFKKKRRAIIWIIVIFGVWWIYGSYRLLTLPMEKTDLPVAVMQPSIKQDDKWDETHYRQILARYDDLCKAAAEEGIKMLIFPEAAIPDYLMINPHVRKDLNNLTTKHQISIFTGFPHAERAPADYPVPYYSYNAASLFSPDGSTQELYYKNILVPVGERMLWLEYFPFLWSWQFGQANWEFGTKIPRYTFQDKTFSPSICYELAFPHFYQRANFEDGQGNFTKADFHVNITNDAWFGTSYGPKLHAMMTKFRAIETRTQFYRSANTGISMIVDPKGQILSSTELFEITNITAPLYYTDEIPFYHKIYRYPIIFVLISLAIFILSFIFPRRTR
jgi:apolipoprotein N-acyltransferase|nr:apolipoprotein N-acyltransferase [Candidatus Cloacimonadota bacterium]